MKRSLNWEVAAIAACALVVFSGLCSALQESAKDKAEGVDCLRNLKLMGLAFGLYMQDYDESTPSFSKADKFLALLKPYADKQDKSLRTSKVDLTVCPAISKPYLINAKWANEIRSPAEKGPQKFVLRATELTDEQCSKTVIMYDPAKHADGTWGVSYFDLHAARINTQPVLGLQPPREQFKYPTPPPPKKPTKKKKK